MPFKDFEFTDSIKLRITKRSSSRKLKLSIASSNLIKVSIPKWTPYALGLKFANSKKKWILDKLPEAHHYYQDQLIAKYHTLKLISGDYNRISSRIIDQDIRVLFPKTLKTDDPQLIQAIEKAIDKALVVEAQDLLPKRLHQLASINNFKYQAIKFKKLRSKWGSCDVQRIITLNIRLMLLPWELIDYVIIHELCHLEHMNHSERFWMKVEGIIPNYKQLRKQIKSYHY